MARVKRGVAAHRRHKRLLKAAEGRKGTKSRLVKPAREALLHALAYATRDRKQRKRQMRQLWVIRINAGVRQHGLTYGRFVAGLKKADIGLEREIDYLGKKGRLTTVLRGIGSLPAEDRPKVGSVANDVQAAIRDAFARAAEGLRGHELEQQLRAESADVTTPGRPIRRGTYHPLPATIE